MFLTVVIPVVFFDVFIAALVGMAVFLSTFFFDSIWVAVVGVIVIVAAVKVFLALCLIGTVPSTAVLTVYLISVVVVIDSAPVISVLIVIPAVGMAVLLIFVALTGVLVVFASTVVVLYVVFVVCIVHLAVSEFVAVLYSVTISEKSVRNSIFVGLKGVVVVCRFTELFHKLAIESVF